ncbi:hypothetical protein DPMN_122714 [Dreissena polymorpha]|uniref:Uncharacterized protein n=1 Tax=Dreissena polymorpha TaxID=45954 RepID=A0A9D4GT33_DREPO|nr:hypothetical protein DPMN_122714 [Dreissena polymorpha]
MNHSGKKTAPSLAKPYKNVTSRKNVPPFGSHYWTINVTNRVNKRCGHKNVLPPGCPLDIIRTNILTKFHEDWTKNVTSRLLTRKNCPHPGDHVFQRTGAIFELIQDIFHEDWTINVNSRPTATPPGSHVLKPITTILKLIQDIIKIHVLTKFYEYKTKNVASIECLQGKC